MYLFIYIDTFVDKGYSDNIRDTEQPPEYN